MNNRCYRYGLRPVLFLLNPEDAHDLTLRLIKVLYPPTRVKRIRERGPQKKVSVFGLDFPNPIGLAAGLDKNGDYIDALFGLGFGFIEVGTVTPHAQPGNPKPRLFRLPKAKALINRFGFNNLGVAHLAKQLKQRRVSGIVGVNIGKNATTLLTAALDDYRCCLEAVYPDADYVTINISSPNTPNLRELQSPAYLNDLLKGLQHTQQRLADHYQKSVPILLKISPDLHPQELRTMVDLALRYKIDGFIAVNTSVQRTAVDGQRHAKKSGGVSGQPLFPLALRNVQQLHAHAPELPIIAVGGIMGVEDAKCLLEAGASLVQVYTGLIYQGPTFIQELIYNL